MQLDDTLRSNELDDHEKAPQYVAKLHRYLNVTALPHTVLNVSQREQFPPPSLPLAPLCHILDR